MSQPQAWIWFNIYVIYNTTFSLFQLKENIVKKITNKLFPFLSPRFILFIFNSFFISPSVFTYGWMGEGATSCGVMAECSPWWLP